MIKMNQLFCVASQFHGVWYSPQRRAGIAEELGAVAIVRHFGGFHHLLGGANDVVLAALVEFPAGGEGSHVLAEL